VKKQRSLDRTATVNNNNFTFRFPWQLSYSVAHNLSTHPDGTCRLWTSPTKHKSENIVCHDTRWLPITLIKR